MEPEALLRRILAGHSANVSFTDLVRLAEAAGFVERWAKGSHRVLAHPDVPEVVNLQGVRSQAKPYQARQVARLIVRYDLLAEEDL